MIIEIPDLLSADQITQLKALFEKAKQQDGKLSAGPAAVAVKNNQEIAPTTDEHAQMVAIVQNALAQNSHLENIVKPIASTIPMFAKYTKGMFYGEHLDIAITNFGNNPLSPIFPGRFRSDVSASIFLNGPEDYDGGELVVQTPAGTRGVKGQAGSMVTYPSGYVHSISEVTRGERLVVVLWFQSYFRDPEQRDMLYKLMNAAGNLMGRYPDDPDVKTINYLYNNLVRNWGDSG